MDAAIYARKSTAQDVSDDAKSVTRQVDNARTFIVSKGWTVEDSHIYIDDGKSGMLFTTRPEFQRMMRDAAAGAFGVVVFFDLDRFGRDSQQSMAALGILAEVDVQVYDCLDGPAHRHRYVRGPDERLDANAAGAIPHRQNSQAHAGRDAEEGGAGLAHPRSGVRLQR